MTPGDEREVPVYLGYAELAKLMNIKLNTAYSKVCRHEIPCIRLSNRLVRFDRNEIIQFMNSRRVPAALPLPNDSGASAKPGEEQ